MKNNFSNNLKFLRKNNNLSQSDLAKELGIARSTISCYENSANEPDLYTLIKLSKFFNCSIDSLVFSDVILDKDKTLTANKISFLDEFNIDKFSHDKFTKEFINKLKNTKQYYINSFKKLEVEIPKKINEIDNLIKLLESALPDDNLPHACTLENKIYSIPLIGTIAAGTPILAQSNIEDYIPIEFKKPLCHSKDYYALKVKGNSMNNLFNDSETLIVEHTSVVDDCDIAVVLINNSEATVKKIKYKNNSILLIPQSNDPSYKIKEYDLKKNSILIQGKVIITLKEYLNI